MKVIDFLQAISKAGLLTWRRRTRCRVGCCFMNKKDGKLLLVIDA